MKLNEVAMNDWHFLTHTLKTFFLVGVFDGPSALFLAETREGLQRQIDVLSNHLLDSGLALNAAKCKSLSIVVSHGRTKKWHCEATSRFQVAGESILTELNENNYTTC